MTDMTRSWKAAAPALALVAAITLAACGSSSKKTSTGAPGTSATTAASNDQNGGGYYGSSASTTSAPSGVSAGLSSGQTTLGTVVKDEQGRTLYAFAPDSATASKCNDACAQTWPPVTTQGQPTTGPGIDASKVGTLTRADGSKQVVYNGHPLYRFSGDSKSGDVNGQGVGGVWHVMTPSGDPKM